MKTIRIAKVKSAAADLLRKAAKIDTNRDGSLSASELRAGRSKVGDAAIHGINKLKSSMVGNRWYGSSDEKGLKRTALKKAVDLGLRQLEDVDAYKGSATHLANQKDGKVTEGEVINYGPARGKLQHMAEQVVWYADHE